MKPEYKFWKSENGRCLLGMIVGVLFLGSCGYVGHKLDEIEFMKVEKPEYDYVIKIFKE